MTVSLQQKQSTARVVARALTDMPADTLVAHRLIAAPEQRTDLIEIMWSVVRHLEKDAPPELTLEPPPPRPLRKGGR